MSIPSGVPERTLGWGVLNWCSTYLAQPNTNSTASKGAIWKFTAEQARFILWFYAVDEYGEFLYGSSYLERAKGVGKSPIGAAVACAELLGPVVFSHFDGQKAVGKAHTDPLVQIAAVSEQQTNQTMDLIQGMLIHGRASKYYDLDIARSRVIHKGYGRLERISSSARSAEGARSTFALCEETHGWVPSEDGPNFFETIGRNLGKGNYRSMQVTNAPLPGELSVAEMTHEEYQRQVESGEITLLFDSESVRVEDIYNPDEMLPALKWIYRNAPWTNYEAIFKKQVLNRANRESMLRRFYLNELVMGESGWLRKADYAQCVQPAMKLKKTDKIALGFRGNASHGAALVAVRLKDGAIFLLKKWEKPDGAGRDWETPVAKVDGFVRAVLDKYDVALMFCQPQNYQDIIGRWAADHDDVVEEFWISNKAKMSKAVEGLETAVISRRMKHNGDPDLQRHILNCHIDEVPQGRLLRKETPNSSRYIFAAEAAVLAFAAATQAIADGALANNDDEVWSF
jgi:hypothetical protein